jgi:hypothetical protein
MYAELLDAAGGGDLATVKRLVADGANVSESCPITGLTALIMAARWGHIAVVQYLVEHGACISDEMYDGTTALLAAASMLYHDDVNVVCTQYLLEAGANIREEMNSACQDVWWLLKPRQASYAVLTSLLKVMVMLMDAPPFFTAKLSPGHVKLVERGMEYRKQLPSYLEQQHALVVAHCPLPAVLHPLVAAYAATTPEDMWKNGLPVSAMRVKRQRVAEGTEATPLRRSLRLRQKRE